MSAPEYRRAVDLPMSTARMRTWSATVWPAFLAACLLEVVVFAVVDPAELRWSAPGGGRAIYTLAFFMFWAISLACSGAALWLARAEQGVSGRSAD